MFGSSTTRHSWLSRIGWLLVLWMAGVGVLAAFALVLRELMRVAGLKN